MNVINQTKKIVKNTRIAVETAVCENLEDAKAGIKGVLKIKTPMKTASQKDNVKQMNAANDWFRGLSNPMAQ